VLTSGLFRIEWSDDGEFEDRASIFAIRRDLPATAFTVERTGSGVVVLTERARLQYDGRPLSAEGLSVTLVGRDAAGVWRFGDERNLGGTARTLDDVDGRTELESGVLAYDGIAMVDDSSSFLFDEDGWIATRAAGRRDVYVFAYGRDFSAALESLVAVSGPPAVLPRWALGNWWSRYHPYTDTSYLELMDRFAHEDLPFSVAVIDMDWHRVGSVPHRYGNGWTGYSWERSLFPDPAAFLRALHERGMRTTLNLHPADGVRAFEDAYPAMADAMGRDQNDETPIAFDPIDPVFLKAYFEVLHHPLEADGVDFWWIDWQQGRTTRLPGVDPLWLLNHFHHLDAARHGGPGMLFSRYAGPGSHRYAVGFSGDAVVSWASLAFQPEFTATAANIGYAWWSHDIGGHTRGVRDDELATRWVQYGVFSPIMRLHSANNPFIRKEPWVFPAEHRVAMGDALRFRHRLVPYLHSMNYGAAAGRPLVRPMYHVEPRRDEAFHVPNQYAFGTELIVAPVTQPRDATSLHGSTLAWLPPGLWTDIFTGSVYRGDRFVDLHRSLSSIPVLLKAGGILPLTTMHDLDATRNPRALEILVAPGASGTFTIIEDAVEDMQVGSTAHTTLRWNAETSEFRVNAVEGRSDVVPPRRTWTITFLADAPSQPVVVDEVPATVDRDVDRFSVTFESSTSSDTVVRLTGGPPELGGDVRERIRQLLDAAQCGNAEKLAAWGVVQRGASAAERIAELATAGLPATVLAAVTELLGTIGADRQQPDGQ
jgi:alpha-glucosidase (family GH31 glycosyl hydrolase)